MPFNPFKSASEKGDEDFQKAYEKGVNLGPQHWGDAYHYFASAAKHYTEAGDQQKAAISTALSTLFITLTSPSSEGWKKCSEQLSALGSTQLNVGFATDSASLANQAAIMAAEAEIMPSINASTSDQAKATRLRELAQKYVELTGSDLALWKLLRQEIDPQSKAYYLMGLASLIDANSFVYSDPEKSVTLFSNAITNFEVAGSDPLGVKTNTSAKAEDMAKIAKCWFCGREVQGRDANFFKVNAQITAYMRSKYGNEMPASIDGPSVVACAACYSAIQNLSDIVAQKYYRLALDEINALAERVSRLESEVSHMRITFTSGR
ncbi:MAG: hypothetical protein QXV32_06310 [Conexivisphaerales archaeon]